MKWLSLGFHVLHVSFFTTRRSQSTISATNIPVLLQQDLKKHSYHRQLEMLIFWDTCSYFMNYSTGIIPDLVKKFLPNFCQWSFMISSTLCFLVAKIDNHASTAHNPSFSRIWSEPGRGRKEWISEWEALLSFIGVHKYDDICSPVPKLSSPHSESLPASIRFPKNFQPVGVSYSCICRALATLEQIGTHK